jgi:AraC-like DNA-binding protein
MKAAARTIDPLPAIWRKPDRSRAVVLPPADRAYWHAPLGGMGPLLYLAWGERQFGEAPIIARRHEGWVCAVVEEGCPTLVRDGRREPVVAGTLVVLGPDCEFGWEDTPGRTSKLLVWMWRTPVHEPIARLPAAAFIRHPQQRCELADLRQLHAATRMEAHRADAHANAALLGLQALLETRIARSRERAPSQDLATRALDWIADHLATRQPMARLADFLGVSAATVHRLFREELGTSVRHKIAELRCHEAERMLASGDVTVKEVAYRLGYRHPHDFSRAFRNYAGLLPTQQRALNSASKLPAAAA